VRFVINTSDGSIAQRIDYDEYGNVTKDTNPGFQPFAFVGGIYDQNTWLIQFGARDYDSFVGRWVVVDPINIEGGLNVYLYVDADPIQYLDLNGYGKYALIKLCKIGYKIIKGNLSFSEALKYSKRGREILAGSSKDGKKLGRAASAKKSPFRDPPHGDGQMPHYHPNPRTGGHIFYEIAGAGSLETYFPCDSDNCILANLAMVADVFNPLSLPKDAIDTYNDLSE
jgi:RHS repeat-associated protein